MGDLIQIRDYQKKPKIETPLQEGLSIIAQAMELPTGEPSVRATLAAGMLGAGIDGLAWPGMDIQAPYHAEEKDPG